MRKPRTPTAGFAANGLRRTGPKGPAPADVGHRGERVLAVTLARHLAPRAGNRSDALWACPCPSLRMVQRQRGIRCATTRAAICTIACGVSFLSPPVRIAAGPERHAGPPRRSAPRRSPRAARAAGTRCAFEHQQHEPAHPPRAPGGIGGGRKLLEARKATSTNDIPAPPWSAGRPGRASRGSRQVDHSSSASARPSRIRARPTVGHSLTKSSRTTSRKVVCASVRSPPGHQRRGRCVRPITKPPYASGSPSSS